MNYEESRIAPLNLQRGAIARLHGKERIVELPRGTAFPRNVLALKEYNSWRFFAVVVFVVSLFSFSRSLILPIVDPGRYAEAARIEYENRGVLKKVGAWFYDTFWQNTPTEEKIRIEADSEVAWRRRCSGAALVAAWLFLWGCFDWRMARSVIYGIMLISFGVCYAFLPIDIVPDAIPVLGQVDDILIVLFGGGLGINSILENKRRRKADDHLREVMRNNPEAAIDIALRDYGLSLEKSQIEENN